MKPSDLVHINPCNSVLQKTEAEVVAINIIKILARTGNKWRKMSAEEYQTERLKDGAFTFAELVYFDDVVDYTISYDTARLFSKEWKLS